MNISSFLQSYIPELDPHKVQPLSIVSHAHSDHVAFNPYSQPRIIICSFETAEIIKIKTKENNLILLPIKYREEYNLRTLLFEHEREFPDIQKIPHDAFLALYPTSHVLGASQIYVRNDKFSLLYSGDFKLQENKSAHQTEIPKFKTQLDFLIMESTFGKPKYVFPSTEIIQNQIKDFCNQSLDSGLLPILFAYSLGKSQEILKLLEGNNFKFIIHSSIFNITEVYRKFNIEFDKYSKYKNMDVINAIEKRSVLIFPPHLAKTKIIKNILRKKTAILTGWATDKSAQYIYNTDECISLSDHADFNDLIKYATEINPKRIFVTHGFSLDLSRELNKRGQNAEPLETYNTLSLF